MTVFEIIDTFKFYGLDVLALAAVTTVFVQILKVTLLKNCQKKIVTFLPFLTGGALYAGFSALVNLSLRYVLDNYVNVLEHGFSVGALSTLIYVWYEQFVRDKKYRGATESVIETLIQGYVPDEETEEIAAMIAHTVATDVTGDGAKKTAEILSLHSTQEITQSDVKMLARLIIETLAHISTT